TPPQAGLRWRTVIGNLSLPLVAGIPESPGGGEELREEQTRRIRLARRGGDRGSPQMVWDQYGAVRKPNQQKQPPFRTRMEAVWPMGKAGLEPAWAHARQILSPRSTVPNPPRQNCLISFCG